MRRKILKLLDRSFEVPLKERDRRRLDRALEASPELRALREAQEALRRKIAAAAAGGFRPGFADRVLERLVSGSGALSAADISSAALQAVFKRFVIVAGLVFLILLSFNLISGELIPRSEVPYYADETLSQLARLPLF